MAVTHQKTRNVSTAAPGATEFPYDFKVLDKAELLVQVDGTTKTVDIDYTVSGVGSDTGGTVTFAAPLAGGESVLRKRNMRIERLTDWQNLGDLRSATLNNDQDAPIMMIQQLADDLEVAQLEGAGLPSGATDDYVLTWKNGVPSWNPPTAGGDPLLRADLEAAEEGKGADIIGIVDPVAPGFNKVLSDMFNGVPVSIQRFVNDKTKYQAMLAGTSTYDAAPDIQLAIDAYSEMQSRRGGRLELGRGDIKCVSTLRTASFSTDNSINLVLAGEGHLATRLNFGGFVRAGALTGDLDAIVIDNDMGIDFEGFTLFGGGIGATKCRDGFHFGRNLAEGGANANAVSRVKMYDIRVQGFARDNIHHYNTYMSIFEDVFSLAAGRDCFHFDGFHTSLTHINCWGRFGFQDPGTFAVDRGAGFRINGMTYSTFMSCGSDDNDYGWIGSNMSGVAFIACGAEGSARDNWYFFADDGTVDVNNPLMVQDVYDVKGVSLINCRGYGGSAGSPGWAGLLRVKASGTHGVGEAGTLGDGSPHKVLVSVRDSAAALGPNSAKAILADQASGGQAEVLLDGYNDFKGGLFATNGARIRNRSMNGQRCKAVMTFNQNIPTAIETPVSFENTNTIDDFNGFDHATFPTRVYAPPGASQVRVTAQASWGQQFTDTSSATGVGIRRAHVRRNGSYTSDTNLGRDERDAAAGAVNTTMHTDSGIIDCVGGTDYFELMVQHTGGKDLPLIAASTYLHVEVIS